MKILILNWRDLKNPNSGGAEIVTHEHAKAWVKAGHNVTLFTSSFPGSKKEEIADRVKIVRGGGELAIKTLVFFAQAALFYWKHFRGRVDLVVDQIHGFGFFTPFYVKEKKLVVIHEVAREIWLYMWPFPIGPLGMLLERPFYWLYRQTSFMTVSQSTKKDLIKMGVPKKKVAVITSGLTCQPLTKLGQKEATPTLIFVGRLCRMKGIEDAIVAFGLVKNKVTASRLWIVGTGEKNYTEKLKKMVGGQGLNRAITFFDFVSDKEKLRLMSRAHLLIHPSVKEGWGLVVIEAAAMGTPAVVYNVAGLCESVLDQETGLLCRQKNPESLAQNIIKIFKDDRLYNKLQKKAWERSKQFSWARSSQASLDMIQSL